MKTIYTVIPYFETENEVFANEVKSFLSWNNAYRYANTLGRRFDIVENELN